MMKNLRKCTLCCVFQSNKPINLPHNEPIIIGRNPLTGIKSTALSKNQLKLIANLQLCTVNVVPLGVNPSGVNGFSIKQHKEYVLHHKDRLELLLDQHIYEIIFDPPPNQDKATEKAASKRKTENVEDNNESHSVKKRKNNERNIPEIYGWEEIDNKLLIYTPIGVVSRNKIASYDLDGTLITTKSGARFPKDADDWKFAFSEVPKKLQELHKTNYKIVIFTNQAGIGLGKMKKNDFKTKIENIIEKLKIPIQVFASTGKGIYRKPAPGMWDALTEKKNNDIEIDLSNSFYCGDAAGRDKNWAPKMKKDHSVADRLFALNLEIDFKTPEEHFLGAKKVLTYTMPSFNPKSVLDLPLLIPASSQLTSKNQELIVFVGSPGSGKSHICNKYLIPEGYVHINRDQLGSWQKCVAAADNALQKKKSVVIDNTNPDIESRKRYIDLSKKFNIPCRCFVMTTDIQQAKHNNLFREITDTKHQAISEIIINSYRKNYVEPTLKEEFTEIIKVNCIPEFADPKQERLYQMYLLEK